MDRFLELVSTPQGLSAAAGFLLSIVMSYAPGLKLRWAAWPAEQKQLTMAGLSIALATVAAFAAPGGFDATTWITSVVAALVANQNTKLLSPDTPAVKQVKELARR